jgi:Tol biopolymer transport system component
MILHRIAARVALVSLMVVGAGRATAQSGNDLFQQALVKERTDGKLEEAIQIYQRIIREFVADRPLVAKALLAMGQSYEKLEAPEARTAYNRLVSDYADQRTQAADARTRLAVLEPRSAAQVGQSVRLLWSDLGRPLDYNDVGPLSPDGRYLSFSVGKEATGLAVLDLKAGRTIPLTNLGDAGVEGSVESSVISPDGRQVAYLWYIWSSDISELRVRQVNDDKDAKSRSVFRNPGYLNVEGWSPDGKSVVVVREIGEGAALTAQIAVISIADGAVRVLKGNLKADNVGGASFSPDGRYVAYERPNGENTPRDIFVLTADGKETPVVVGPGQDRDPLWSPDGSHIVFLSNRTGNMSLWMIPVAEGVATGPATLVKANVGPFYPLGIARSGALYYVAGTDISNVYTAELDARANSAIAPSMATNQYLNSNRAGTWSPDGQNLAYIVTAPRGALIRIRSAKTGEDREVPAIIQVSGPVRWFPDGQSLLVASRDARIQNGNVAYYRMNIVSGTAELLHQTSSPRIEATRPDLSPDGRTIFYLEAPRQPVRFDIDSRHETRLTPPGDSAYLSLAVSPDGAQVAYVGAELLVVAPSAGGKPREVARFSGESSPRERADGLGLAWSPDQRCLFYVRPEIRAIWRVPLAGGEPENIGVSMNRLRTLRVHPDGRRITFDSVIDAPSELWVLENFLPKGRGGR